MGAVYTNSKLVPRADRISDSVLQAEHPFLLFPLTLVYICRKQFCFRTIQRLAKRKTVPKQIRFSTLIFNRISKCPSAAAEIEVKSEMCIRDRVYTVLHAGGKFGGGGYKVSGGLHGVGASVVNALSEWLTVQVHRDGKIYEMKFARGHVTEPMTVVGTTDHTGTTVTFKPDPEMFEDTVYNYDTLHTRMREEAFLNAGLRITIADELSLIHISSSPPFFSFTPLDRRTRRAPRCSSASNINSRSREKTVPFKKAWSTPNPMSSLSYLAR